MMYRTLPVLVFSLLCSVPALAGDECESPYIYLGEWQSRYIDIEKSNSLLFLINEGEHQIELLDASDPSSPLLILTYTDIDGLRSMTDATLRWPYLYVTDAYRGLIILDFGNLFSIRERGVAAMPWLPNAIDVAGHYAYIAHANSGLIQVDIHNPDLPVIINTTGPENQQPMGIDATADLVSIGYFNGLTQIYDSSHDGKLTLLSEIQVPEQVTSMEMSGDKLYIGTSDDLGSYADRYLYQYDISDPTRPVENARIAFQSNLIDIDVESDSVYLTSKTEGLWRLNADLDPVSQLSIPYNLSKTVVEDGVAFSAVPNHQLLITNIGAARTPSRTGWHHIDEIGGSQIERSGNFIYILGSNFDDAIAVIDTSDPDNWIEHAPISTHTDESDQLVVTENLLLHTVTTGALDRLDIYSLSNPAAPELLSSTDLPGNPSKISLDETMLYVSFLESEGILVLELSAPENPIVIDTISESTYFSSFEILGDRLYAIRGTDQVDQFGIDDPTDIQLLTTQYFPYLGSIDNLEGTLAVYASTEFLSPEFLYLCDLEPDGQLLLHSPMYLEQGHPIRPRKLGDHIFTPQGDHGLSIWNLPDAQSPQLAANLTFPHSTSDLVIDGNTMLVPVGERVYTYELNALCGFSCAADLNRDGALDFFDVSAFLVAFNDEQPLADLDGNGLYDFFDVSHFLEIFIAGCP